MRRSVAPYLLASALLTGCDVEFVAVDLQGTVTVRSEQTAGLDATLDLRVPDEGAAPRVRLGGTELQGTREGGRWRFQTSLPLDTLEPRLELEIQGPEAGRSLLLPLMARNGPATWREDGDLELPLVYGGDPAPSAPTWQLTLLDANGSSLARIGSEAVPLPTPLVVRREWVAEDAVVAWVTTTLFRDAAGDPYPVGVAISGSVRIAVPGSE